MEGSQFLQEEVEVGKRELRLVSDGFTRWRQEIQPQPRFGEVLSEWMQEQKHTQVSLSKLVGCSSGTIGSWCKGSVPSPEYRDKLVAAGYPGEFFYLTWSQEMFVRSELVKMRNRNYVEGSDHPDREFLEKYLIHCRMPRSVFTGRGKARTVEIVWEDREVLFTTRVTDVVKVVGDDSVLSDWTSFQGLCEMVGEPVLVGTAMVDGVLSKVEIRGSYRKIMAWQKKCINSQIHLDQSRARIRDFALYSKGELLEFHWEAFKNRYVKRDEAGLWGTRAHKLGQAWIQYHALQERDEQGLPLIDAIMAPRHFWDSSSTDETIIPVYLGNEPEAVQNAIKALQAFWIQNRLKLIATEILLACLVSGVAGAVDCVVEDMHGNLLILDWKTSNGVYAKMFNQVSIYALLWFRCKGVWPARVYIVRLDKMTAQVQVICVYADEATRKKRIKNVLNILEVYRGNEDLESDVAAAQAESEKD